MEDLLEYAAAEMPSSPALSTSFPPIVHDHLPNRLQKLCGESRTRRSSLPFYDMLSERFGVLELPERQEDVVFSLLQSSKALVTQSFWISFFLEVQPARSTRAGLITTDGGGLRSGWGLFIMTLRITAI